MADNVVTIAGNKVFAPEEPVTEVLELLEGLLERARKGEIRAVAFAVSTNEDFGSGWTTEGTENHKAKLLAAVGLLQFRMNYAIEEYGSTTRPGH